MRRSYESGRGYTGHLIEQELFGELKENPYKDEFLPFRQSIEYCRSHQPYNPCDPAPQFANDLHATIVEALRFKDYSRLKFYTAVHSPLDFKHGIDAFLEVEKEPGIILARVTLDVTSNPWKGATYRADIVFYVPGDGLDRELDRKMWNDKIQEVATKASDFLQIGLRQNLTSARAVR